MDWPHKLLFVAFLILGASIDRTHGDAMVSGTVFCDQCKDGQISLFDYPIYGVKVEIICRDSNGQITVRRQETTNLVGNYAMRFDGAPDLSTCHAQVSGTDQNSLPCGLAAGPEQTVKLMFKIFDLEMYTVNSLLSQPPQPMSFCPASAIPNPGPTNPIPVPMSPNPYPGPATPAPMPQYPIPGPPSPIPGPVNPVPAPQNPFPGQGNPIPGPNNPYSGPANPIPGLGNPFPPGPIYPIPGSGNPFPPAPIYPIPRPPYPFPGSAHPYPRYPNPIHGPANPFPGSTNSAPCPPNVIPGQRPPAAPPLRPRMPRMPPLPPLPQLSPLPLLQASTCSYQNWSMPEYRCHWRAVNPDMKVASIFGSIAERRYGRDMTLNQGLQGRGDPYKTLLREGITALLNSYHSPLFQYHAIGVVQHVNWALMTSQRQVLLTALGFMRANSGSGIASCRFKPCN